jgi:hypothetical protein
MRRFGAVALLAGLWPTIALAAWTGTTTAVIPQQPRIYIMQIPAAATTSNVITPGANGTILTGIGCVNTDTAAYTISLQRIRGGTTYVEATMSIPASSGNTSGTPPFDMLSQSTFGWLPINAQGEPFLIYEGSNGAGDTFKVVTTIALAAGKTITCFAEGADF